MIKLIRTFINLYKVIKLTKEGDLIIEYNKSTIKFKKGGDLIINAGRHTIHKRELFFDGCDSKFIEEAIKENSKSKKDLEKFVMRSNRASEFTCREEENRVKKNDGN